MRRPLSPHSHGGYNLIKHAARATRIATRAVAAAEVEDENSRRTNFSAADPTRPGSLNQTVDE